MNYNNPPLDELRHYGTPRHSGRYPWGSGDNPYQRNKDFMARYETLKKQGKSDSEIAAEMKVLNPRKGTPSSTILRQKVSAATNALRLEKIKRAQKLKEKGYGATEIARLMSVNGEKVTESNVRSWLNSNAKSNAERSKETAKVLQQLVSSKGYIDVGKGVELEMGVTKAKKDAALEILKQKGYNVHTVRVPQITDPSKKTTIEVLCPPGTEWKEVVNNMDRIKTFSDYAVSNDDGKTFNTFQPPVSISSKRISVRYDEDGGTNKDGTIEIRRGVPDLSLGASSYAQVRIAVDGTHYIKGMAFYSDGKDMPPGVDIIVNSNRKKGTPLLKNSENGEKVKNEEQVLKTLKSDPSNPFGALIKPYPYGQSTYTDKDGKEKLSAINKIREEGDWDDYKKTLSSQVLSKQSLALARQQLDIDYQNKREEFNTIMSLTNEVVKKELLEKFSTTCDSAAVHLKAAALPRQTTKVILPVPSLKDNEVYAPSFKNGETVVLIRYPHQGTFEIPKLVVNNNNKEAVSILGKNPQDAIGINYNVAAKLSGADFDGDTAVIIPVNDKVKITTSDPLPGLKGFEPKNAYPYKEGIKLMKNTQNEMGRITNLITDMTINGAPPEELARAVRHSQVVIDAEKHSLDYKQSELDNDIAGLKKRWGSRTLISLAKGQANVPEMVRTKDTKYKPDPVTGDFKYEESGRMYTVYEKDEETGKSVAKGEKLATMKTTNMEYAFMTGKDAYSLSSGTPIESIYADYANKVKAMGNEARKAALTVKPEKASPSAKKVYEEEVKSLKDKLDTALRNAPKERQAQLVANLTLKSKIENDPDIQKDKSAIKKAKQWALSQARAEVGAKRQDVLVQITDKEWEAIQNKAVSPTTLKSILNNTDMDAVKKLAMPRTETGLTTGQINRINNLKAMGYTVADIADQLGISTSTVSGHLKESLRKEQGYGK